MSTPVLDSVAAGTAHIRSFFPALERREGSERVAYFDGPGGTQTARPVVEAITDYLYHHNANTHWAYPSSAETDALIESARATVADFFNARSDEVVFGANMTTLTFHLARGLGRAWGPGDEIVVTELDHHGNVAPWQALARERGVTLRVVKLDPATGQLDWRDLEQNITARCRLLAIGAASNALGTITDVRAAAGLARSAGALVFVDAVHYAPHVLPDVHRLGCDFLACSAYKFYGPHIGVLWVRHDLVNELDVPRLIPAPDIGPERLETGTQNHEGIVGTVAAIHFLAGLAPGENRRQQLARAYQLLHERSTSQLQTLWDALSRMRHVRLYGPPADSARTPTIAFTVERVPSTEVARRLARRGIFVSHGDFYAHTVIERLGLQPEGLVRAGCACYTSDDEIDRFIVALEALPST